MAPFGLPRNRLVRLIFLAGTMFFSANFNQVSISRTGWLIYHYFLHWLFEHFPSGPSFLSINPIRNWLSSTNMFGRIIPICTDTVVLFLVRTQICSRREIWDLVNRFMIYKVPKNPFQSIVLVSSSSYSSKAHSRGCITWESSNPNFLVLD